MPLARVFLLLCFSAAFGACSSDSSSGTTETTTVTKPPKTIAAAYDSAVANTDSAGATGKQPIPVNVPATEYSTPPSKVAPPVRN